MTPARSAAAAISAVSAGERAGGFSAQKCLPAAAAASAISRGMKFGVAVLSASASGWGSTARQPGGRGADAERGVELARGRSGGEPADELERLGGGGLAIQADVLPLDGQRPVVADPVEAADEVLPAHVAAPDTAKVPASPAVAERQM